MSKCASHHPVRHYKVGDEWRCSGCGKVERWSEEWSYYGAIGCTKCGCEPVIDFVACSEACRAKFSPDAKGDPFATLRAEDRERAVKAATLDAIDKKIAKLKARREELAG